MKRNTPGIFLILISASSGMVMAIPILYVIYRSFFAGKDRWLRLMDSRIPSLLWNTLSLATVVTLISVVLGASLAWLIYRCDLPKRNIFKWLLSLPLVIPPYVGAVTYIIVFGPQGLMKNLINVYSFWGVAFVMTMFCYPYVFLIVGSALNRMNRNYEEAARSQGLSPWQVFVKVNLRLLRPAIGAGAVLVFLYILSDFGGVAVLRYTTFTSAIYYQMGSYDNISATILSMILIVLTVIVLWFEAFTKKKQKFYQTSNSYRKPLELSLGKWRVPAVTYVSLVFLLSVFIPISILIYWSGQGVGMGAINVKFFGYIWNTIKVAGFASIFCMVLSLPIVYIKSRHPSLLSKVIDKLSYSGYALPGVIVALGIIFIFNQYIPFLYGSYILISIAYMIRFLPQAMQANESSLSLISPRIDEASRNLGYYPFKTLYRVIVPLIKPGIVAGGALVFVNSVKELPATLLLRPPGFDTLSVRVWVEASESLYHLAAPASLIIILISIIPLKWMLSKY